CGMSFDARPAPDARPLPPDAHLVPPDARPLPPDARPACVPTSSIEFCTDGIDNDCNGLTDCDDPQCKDTAFCTCKDVACEPGTPRYCDEAKFCHWGNQTCGPDHAWGACVETNQHPAGCNFTLYNSLCCEEAGACCEDVFDHHSIGNCPSVTQTCTYSH